MTTKKKLSALVFLVVVVVSTRKAAKVPDTRNADVDVSIDHERHHWWYSWWTRQNTFPEKRRPRKPGAAKRLPLVLVVVVSFSGRIERKTC